MEGVYYLETEQLVIAMVQICLILFNKPSRFKVRERKMVGRGKGGKPQWNLLHAERSGELHICNNWSKNNQIEPVRQKLTFRN